MRPDEKPELNPRPANDPASPNPGDPGPEIPEPRTPEDPWKQGKLPETGPRPRPGV